MLSDREKAVLSFISDYQRVSKGRAPTPLQIAIAVRGISSAETVERLLAGLEMRGIIKRAKHIEICKPLKLSAAFFKFSDETKDLHSWPT